LNLGTPTGGKLIVHLVHGTWPYGPGRQEPEEGEPPAWFEDGSPFREEVQAHADRSLEYRAFRWSGENSFTARHQAAVALRTRLKEALAEGGRHAIVAHSHGGTVAFHAVDGLDIPSPGRLDKLITLGTPFATLREASLPLHEAVLLRNSVRLAWILPLCTLAAYLLGSWLVEVVPNSWVVLWYALLPLVSFDLSRWSRPGEETRLLLRDLISACLLGLGLIATLAVSWAEGSIGWTLLFGPAFSLPVLLGWDLLTRQSIEADHQRLQALVRQGRPRMPCALFALRTPNDEAGLAISASQFLDMVLTAVRRTMRRFSVRAVKRLDGWWGWLLVPAVWFSTALLSWGLDKAVQGGDQSLPSHLVRTLGPVILGSVLVLLFFAWVMVCLAYVGSLVVRLTTGEALLRHAGLVKAEVEALPPGVAANLEILSVTEEEWARLPLSHSLHELEITRRRVGELLQ
jgi:hypothetical protein